MYALCRGLYESEFQRIGVVRGVVGMSSQQRLSNVGKSEKEPDIPGHLSIIRSDGRLVCEECRAKITIDPVTSVEYGHKRNMDKVFGNKCSHRGDFTYGERKASNEGGSN